jgi:succinyl-diaminopimelate desuccinylase
MLSLDDPVALTRQLVAIGTVNPPGDEADCAAALREALERIGFAVSWHPFDERRVNLVARIGGRPDRKPICFTGHMDTVPLGAAPWHHDPFGGELDGGRLYGRGSSDMKSGIAAFVVAAAQLRRELEQTAGLVLVITGGEETGCQGAMSLARQAGALGAAGAIIVAEPTANYPLVGHKGALWLRVRATGVTAHGSMPERGENAIYKAARVVQALERFEFAADEHPLMGLPTLNVGTIKGGLNINSVPDAVELTVDIRTVPGVDHAVLLDRVRQASVPEAEVEPILNVGPVISEPGGDWIQRVFQLAAKAAGEPPAPRTAPYFTDAAALKVAYGGAPALILGPGEPQMAHQTDEYCLVNRVEAAVMLYRAIMEDWCEC